MWISRKLWEEKLVECAEAHAEIRVVTGQLKAVVGNFTRNVTAYKQLKARNAQLEAHILDLNDKLNTATKVVTNRVEQPVSVDDLFSEDETEVEKDRELIRSEGTSDILLSEMETA